MSSHLLSYFQLILILIKLVLVMPNTCDHTNFQWFQGPVHQSLSLRLEWPKIWFSCLYGLTISWQDGLYMLLTWSLFSLCVGISISFTFILGAVPSKDPNLPQAYLLYFVFHRHRHGPLLCINLFLLNAANWIIISLNSRASTY